MFPSMISLHVGLPTPLQHAGALSVAVATRHLGAVPATSSPALTVSSLAVTLELLVGGLGLMLVSALALRRLRR